MKKDIKTQITREKIIQAAIEEFGMNGYEGASVNAVCERHKISKGLIYHNFKGKDEIYLICFQRVIDELTQFIHNSLDIQSKDSIPQLKDYINTRKLFFKEHPWYLKIFCEAIIFPPTHLEESIQSLKGKLDDLNAKLIKELISKLKLRDDVSEEKIIKTLTHSFDYFDILSQRNNPSLIEREHIALDILLYGLIER